MKQCNKLRHIYDSSYNSDFLSFHFWSCLFFSAERYLDLIQWQRHHLNVLKIDTNCRLIFWIVKCQYCLLDSLLQPNLMCSTSQSSFTEDYYHRTYKKKNRGKREEHDKQYTYKRNIEKCLRNHCYRGKAVSITYSECVSVALGIKHAKCTRRILLSSVACLTLPYLFSLSFKRHDFRERAIECKICFVFLYRFVCNFFLF
jgi:hypothetical protein